MLNKRVSMILLIIRSKLLYSILFYISLFYFIVITESKKQLTCKKINIRRAFFVCSCVLRFFAFLNSSSKNRYNLLILIKFQDLDHSSLPLMLTKLNCYLQFIFKQKSVEIFKVAEIQEVAKFKVSKILQKRRKH